MIIAAALVAIANGLLSTLAIETSTAKWVGYQVLAGAGRGLGLQIVRFNLLPCALVLLTDFAIPAISQ
jgi:hypothetical protein